MDADGHIVRSAIKPDWDEPEWVAYMKAEHRWLAQWNEHRIHLLALPFVHLADDREQSG